MNHTRREMLIAGMAAGPATGLAGMVNPMDLAGQVGQAQSSHRKLTVKELRPEEIAEMDRLEQESRAAYARQDEYHRQLRAHYGHDLGVQVDFEQGYVFIRDFRAEMAEKAAAINEQMAGGYHG